VRWYVAAAEAEEVEELEEHPDEAYVTLATNDVYAVGAMVLAYSLRATCTTRQLVVMVTPEVSSAMRELLPQFFDVIFDVTPIDSNDFDNLSLLNRQVRPTNRARTGGGSCSASASKSGKWQFFSIA